MTSDAEVIARAKEARKLARAPFSNFKVGAAIADSGGRIYTGCNIENASYGLTMCAERVAVFKAISEGASAITTVAVVADTDTPTPPCGACRQLLWEFCQDARLILANLQDKTETMSMAEILPRAFDASFL